MYDCMYVCTYVCMYVCMYARMHVCMQACVYVPMYPCMYDTFLCRDKYLSARMHTRISCYMDWLMSYVLVYICVDARVFGILHVDVQVAKMKGYASGSWTVQPRICGSRT